MAQFKLRITDDLYEQAKNLAKSRERSLNWWINDLIRRAVLEATTPKTQEQQ